MKRQAPEVDADTLDRMQVMDGHVMVEIRSFGDVSSNLVLPERTKQANRGKERSGYLHRVGGKLRNDLHERERVWFLIVGGKEVYSGSRQFWVLPEDNILAHDPDDTCEAD